MTKTVFHTTKGDLDFNEAKKHITRYCSSTHPCGKKCLLVSTGWKCLKFNAYANGTACPLISSMNEDDVYKALGLLNLLNEDFDVLDFDVKDIDAFLTDFQIYA